MPRIVRASLLSALAVVLMTGLTAVPASAASAATCDDDCKIAAARSYIDALVSHDASNVPLAPKARRVENGIVTGRSGEGIRKNLNTSPFFHVIMKERDLVVSVEGDVVTTDYVLETGLRGVHLANAYVHETFTITPDGKISLIIAKFRVGLPRSA